jgi:hypothetical protein
MWLAREVIKANLVAEMTPRFPARHGNFPEAMKISALGFPNSESLREWGKILNRAKWFTGWFTPSEFLACETFGRDPKATKPKPNLIDLMFNTQTRPPELTVSFTAAKSLAGGKSVKSAAKKAKKAAKASAKKAGKKTAKKPPAKKAIKKKLAKKKGGKQ